MSDMHYLAGLIDGEGCITIVKQAKRYRPHLGISMNHEGVLLWVKKKFGGGLYNHSKATEAARLALENVGP